jgi:hypothetical protein
MYDLHLTLSNEIQALGPGGGSPGPGPFVQNCDLAWRIPPGTYQTLHAAGSGPISDDFFIPDVPGTISFIIDLSDLHGFDGWPAGGTGGTVRLFLSGSAGVQAIPLYSAAPGGSITTGLHTGPLYVAAEITDSIALALLKGETWHWEFENGDNRESWEMTVAQVELFMTVDGPCNEGSTPGALMHVKNEFVADGDGTTTDFTTRYPYTAGSLEVFVDGVPIINGYTEEDPDAGTFSLDFAPQGASGDTRAERVTVNYQANVGGPGT